MKKSYLPMILATILCGTAQAETVYVIETIDLQKRGTFEVVNSDKLHELQKTVAAEGRVFQRALEAVRKDWENVDKLAPGEKPAVGAEKVKAPPPPPFPAGMLAPRRIEVKCNFNNEKEAEKKRALFEKLAADDLKKAEESDKKKYDGIKDPKKQAARRAADQDRVSAADRVSSTLQSKMDELIKASAAPAPDAAPATGGAGEAKPAAAKAN